MVWATSVLPALFPFFFFTTLLCELRFVDKLGFFMQRPLKRLYNVSNNAGLVYIMSMISGYPVGAKLISELYQNNMITKQESGRIHAFCSTSGPIFVIGTVGSSMLGSYKAGCVILIVHLLSALLNGLLYRRVGVSLDLQKASIFAPTKPLDNLLSNTIYQSVISILMVGGYIALSFLFCEFLIDTHILDMLCIPLDFVLKTVGLNLQFGRCIVLGLTEITRGNLELSSLFATNPRIVVILLCGIISFGGLSVTLQSMTYLSKCGITTKFYLLQKLTHCLIATFLAVVITLWI